MIEIQLPYFGNEISSRVLTRSIPVIKIKTKAGDRLVTTVYDLNLANYSVDRGLGTAGEAHSYNQNIPFTPKWQEKLRPAEGWARIMTATDWNGGAKLQNSTSFFYFATDQWRSEEVDTAPLVAAGETPRYRHCGDYNVLAARLGWLPFYPNTESQKQIAEVCGRRPPTRPRTSRAISSSGART